MKAIDTIEEALLVIDKYQGQPQNFKLPISKKLLDPVGINMAIITDRILSNNWMPDGYNV